MTEKENWTVVELLKWTSTWFKNQGIISPRRQAEELLCHVLDLKRLDLYLQFDYVLTRTERRLFKTAIQRRAKGEPLQYIKGYQDFCGLKIKTDARALIPRIETEILVSRLLERLSGVEEPKVIELGTGSGCLGLGLAHGGSKVWAVDISESALSLARENAQQTGLADKIGFSQGDLFVAFEKRGPARASADLVVSNPPYIGEDERAEIESQVKDFEPSQALFSGADGSDILRRIVSDSPVWLKPGGFLALEMASRHGEMLAQAADQGPWQRHWIEKDDQNQDRYFFAVLKGSAQSRG